MQEQIRQIITTSDGSHSIYVPSLDEHYHSVHGAIQESNHVFIDAGLAQLSALPQINILEIGFGTGLNALLTLHFATQKNLKINYKAVEKYPLMASEYKILNYASNELIYLNNSFLKMHTSPWEQWVEVQPDFNLFKVQADLVIGIPDGFYHLVYFDAFAPDKQAGLWSQQVFEQLYQAMLPGAILVTYCAKGQVRRNMQAAGLKTERIAGPPGKREMLRARKIS